MKKLSLLFAITFLLFSCNKENSSVYHDEETIVSKKRNSEVDLKQNINNIKVKWGKNEETYIAALKLYADKLTSNSLGLPNSISTTNTLPIVDCDCSNPVTYSFYDDPEDLVKEGAYVVAGSSLQETQMASCPELLAAITSAKAYLLDEGYGDIVSLLDTPAEKYNLVHAANSLIDMKMQLVNAGYLPEIKLANCVLQAIGYTAIAELGANWAVASRQVILRAVGKIATRYLGWFGAAIAVTSFADCMWG